MGHGEGGNHRERLGMTTKGPTRVITDLCILEPDPQTKELTVVSIHQGVSREQIVENCGWAIKFAHQVIETPAPTEIELATLRDINARTKRAHQGAKEALNG
jgi:glutaconate CoA-transferase subunit B